MRFTAITLIQTLNFVISVLRESIVKTKRTNVDAPYFSQPHCDTSRVEPPPGPKQRGNPKTALTKWISELTPMDTQYKLLRHGSQTRAPKN